MYILVFGLGIFFLLLPFLLNEKTARYLLAGYNTMSEKEREAFDLKGYLKLFRKFHFFMGLSFIVLGVLLLEFVGENALGIFLGLYPILAYIWFLIKSQRFQNSASKRNKWALAVMLLTLLGVLFLFVYGFRENKIELIDEKLVISGMYGVELPLDKLEKLELREDLPLIDRRMNGFNSGAVKRGIFREESGAKLRLLIGGKQKQLIYIKPQSGYPIYYSAAEAPNDSIYNILQKNICKD